MRHTADTLAWRSRIDTSGYGHCGASTGGRRCVRDSGHAGWHRLARPDESERCPHCAETLKAGERHAVRARGDEFAPWQCEATPLGAER